MEDVVGKEKEIGREWLNLCMFCSLSHREAIIHRSRKASHLVVRSGDIDIDQPARRWGEYVNSNWRTIPLTRCRTTPPT